MRQATPRYKNGQRLDNPYLTPLHNPLLCNDGKPRRFRAKLVKFPEGSFELSVVMPKPEEVEAMGRVIRPCDMLPKKRTDEEQTERDEQNRNRACREARKSIRWLVKCVGADHLLTLTYREVAQDKKKLGRDFQEFVRLVRLRYSGWVYVAVIEKQRSDQPDWSYHMHLAVRGKQDIKWLLRCWLRAIGQPHEEVEDWYLRGFKLGEKSYGAVNVKGPDRRYRGRSQEWKADRLSAYLTKYISKEFDVAEKNAKKYWHPKGINKPEVIRTWLAATNYAQAVRDAFDILCYTGVTDYDRLFGTESLGIIWISASTDRKVRGRCTQGMPDFDLLND